MKTPLVVVGAGAAGLSVALSAAPRPVILLARGRHPLECASALAQGGIAAALAANDHPRLHARDTRIAGSGSNRRSAVRLLTRRAAEAIHWLQGLGLPFDHAGDALALGLEGGHSRHRIAHAGGDASGRRLVETLAAAAMRAAHIDWRAGCELEALALRSGRIGAIRYRDRHGSAQELACDELVLACGGAAGLFAISTHPASSDGSGLALALAAGAHVRDLHSLQFHPTALATAPLTDGRHALVTEALRGAGAVLTDRDGRRFMLGLHPLAELAPRDRVARAVEAEWAAERRAFLDATRLELDWTLAFPSVLDLCQQQGLDPRTTALPVRAAAHYQMGGVAVDLDGRSSLPGLSAVGEVACTGVHGGNRLASNSLLEALVFGRRVGRRLARSARHDAGGPARWTCLGEDASESTLQTLRRLASEALGPLRRIERVRAARRQTQAGAPLGQCWQGQLLDALLASALARPRSHGAHHWSD